MELYEPATKTDPTLIILFQSPLRLVTTQIGWTLIALEITLDCHRRFGLPVVFEYRLRGCGWTDYLRDGNLRVG
jgi:hypothetical protein